MKFEKTEVWGFEHAIRGMRNPKNSWDKSDSFECSDSSGNCENCPFYINNHQLSSSECMKDNDSYFDTFRSLYIIGKNDLDLAQRLIKAGSEHRKFLRQVFVSVDITAPMYWWNEFDIYKVGTVANSTSKMHKLASTPITRDCFEMDDFISSDESFGMEEFWTSTLIPNLEWLRVRYNETKDKRYWKELIRLLPESWLQKRTVTTSYENVLNMYHQRCVHPHKLTEWSVVFKNWVESLPYAEQFFIEPFEKGENKK